MFLSSTAAAAQQQWWRRRRVAVWVPAPRVKPERQMKKMEHRSGTFFRDSAYYKYALRADQHCGSCSAMHRGSWNSRSSSTAAAAQEQQHRSSSTAAAAQQQRWQRRRGYGRKDERGYTGELFVVVLALWRNLERTSADTPRSLQLTTAVLLCR